MILNMTLDEKHRQALYDILDAARDNFNFDGWDDDGAAEQVLDDILEALEKEKE